MLKYVKLNAIYVSRCMMLENSSNASEWVFVPSERVIDSCTMINFDNETVNCQKWAYDNTYYGPNRVTQVILSRKIYNLFTIVCLSSIIFTYIMAIFHSLF